MSKTVQQLLAHATQQRAAAAAAGGAQLAVTAKPGDTPAPAAPVAKVEPEGDKPAEPTASAPEVKFVVEGGQVFVDGATVADGKVELLVTTGEDGKHIITGLAIAAAEPAKDLAGLVTEISAKAVALSAAEAQVTEMEGQLAACVGIVAASLGKMNVALGGAQIDVSKMDVATLLAQHESVATQFASRFPVGGVAAVTPASEPKAAAQEDVETREFLAQVQHVASKAKPAN